MPLTDTIFSDRSLWTMLHGIALSGAALIALAAAIFHLYAAGADRGITALAPPHTRPLPGLLVFAVATLWLAVLVGTYVIFPLYRAVPPEAATSLAAYPKALIEADPNSAWLHSFGMEIKEHVPWIAAMLATPVAFVSLRYRSRLLSDATLRRISMTLLALSFALVSITGLLGILINKFAPLE